MKKVTLFAEENKACLAVLIFCFSDTLLFFLFALCHMLLGLSPTRLPYQHELVTAVT